RAQVERALESALVDHGRLAEASQICDKLIAAFPDDSHPNPPKAAPQIRLGKVAEARTPLEDQFKANPRSLGTRRMLSQLAAVRNDAHAVDIYLRTSRSSDSNGRYANERAWHATFLQPVPSWALAGSFEAVKLRANSTSLYTLAAIYAEL